MTIHYRSILVHDGKVLTEAGEDFCARLYEHPTFAIEGEPRCWHDWDRKRFFDWAERGFCVKCSQLRAYNSNPSLLTDLNAVHELETIALETHRIIPASTYFNALIDLYMDKDFEGYEYPFIAPAHIRLEALATVLTVECRECKGEGLNAMTEHFDSCPACSGTGRVSIIDQWEREWK